MMRAVGVTEFGGPEVLQVLQVDEPDVGPGEVRIDVRAASVVPADALFRSGALAARLTTGPPWIPGTEVAGVVERAPGAGPWHIGDEVIAIVVPFHQRPGAYAERVVVPVGSVALRPQSCDFARAATLPMSGLTASALLDLLPIEVTSTLAVTGAAGVVGGFVRQLAERIGVTVLSDAPDGELNRGADYASQIRRLAPDGVDAIVDSAGIGQPLMGAVRDGGTFASLRSANLQPEREISLVNVLVWNHAEDQARLANLSNLVDKGDLVLPQVQAFAPEDARQAHEALGASGRARGVLVF
jgi:NADPH2:quinone reductase